MCHQCQPIQIQIQNISETQRDELVTKLAERIFNEILGYVKNPFIGYAIVIDKDEIIQAHPDIDRFVGERYTWPRGTEPLKEGEELKIQRILFKGEPHFDFAAPVIVRDKNIGTAYIGSVHIGLREDYILKNISAAKPTPHQTNCL